VEGGAQPRERHRPRVAGRRSPPARGAWPPPRGS
jgi:hypothetical protein